MIQELDIQNLAIIDHLRISFSSGMTVLTGETGAGKSIIIDALNLLTGSRGSKRYIRTGCKKLVLQGLFVFPKNSSAYRILDQLGIDHSDGSVIIQREIYRNGRNLCRINGLLVNTSALRKLGSRIVDIQGQDAHQTLMDPATHLRLLDAFDKKHIQPVLDKYQRYYARYQKLTKLVHERTANQQEWAQHIDMLKFQSHDIKKANLKPNEDETLTNKKNLLKNYQNISTALQKSYEYINGNDSYSPLDMIGSAMNTMQNISQYGDNFKKIQQQLANAYYDLQDVANTISDQLESQTFDEDELNRIESRLDLIDQLKHKYGNSIDKILMYYSRITEELNKLQTNKNSGESVTSRLKKCKDHLQKYGQQLSVLRHQIATKLEKRIKRQLKDLYMGQAIFKVHFENTDDFHSYGTQKIEFYVRTNPGEKLLPLASSASGGELSRIMLALKTVFAKVQNVSTIVFDEIDTGVSGRVAQAIADKMVMISRHAQVLCITHLPQVAAMSDHHFLVKKHVSKNQTSTRLKRLSHQGKIDELARMLAGTKVTKLALEHASELLKLADQAKQKISFTG
ncbi:DNA repair protein RecN [Acetilactobacillus jinshanensis]|uniref:DNA repair protein RecN n=1 Tax=Acetilactobacillus jinshanensis TaxID=1720083 RepID=A0A4P6ZLA4_9LACO|nr:DNA repair protein RecN [Acetilactobacillus jinshanensis]QBP18631.1 DNA repair protein RecN [Acetilactobacillus jinshanensis]URL61507.1 DNA repair protein RecN [uncultured bacterium]